jgi:hypothetical protein
LSITGHYIDGPIDRPNDWVLKTEQLSFETIEGRHTGKNIASILTCTVYRYELNGKVMIEITISDDHPNREITP